ncbi:GntR family transcriptional regulator [Marinibacterium profundimaris]|uniref:GntR family transcriptional regulator n=1 Tax=Marinibacterium profundimaris TaxID=1679460 RepID=UPI001303B444|nr:GntR family transcriptional regulator [Marinibacterium profundimaris]
MADQTHEKESLGATEDAAGADTAPRETGRPATRAEEIAAALEDEIVQGELEPGRRLDEQILGRRFEVSRTPVREALRLLAASGLVTIEPRIGAVVARPTVSEVFDLFELVGEMEAVAARLACERMTDHDRERIMQTHDACREAGRSGDADAYIARNDAFHAAIHTASENRALRDQIELLNKRLAPYRRFITFRPERKQAAEQEHETLAAALLDGDAEAAARAMKEHVRMLADDAFVLARSLRL